MKNFDAYARYYNLLYRDKDYQEEADYVLELLRRHGAAAGPLQILDLGCGTGRHDFALAERGCHVTGVDRAQEMVDIATAAKGSLDVEFLRGDLRGLRLGRSFDAATALFHVISYQTGDDDLAAAFDCAAAHLEPGGLFVFDCWYGPAVLTDRPATRVKRLADASLEVVRVAEPAMHATTNVVDVNYSIFGTDKASGQTERIEECHRMRYLFSPELERLLGGAGFDLAAQEEWLTGKELGYDTWGACFVARKR